jgi:uncharacterized damage-inducible protein DinB
MNHCQTLADDIRRSVEGDAWHGPSVREVLEGVSATQAAARPPGDAHSIHELTLHIAAWMEEVADRLEGGYHSEPLMGNFPAPGHWEADRRKVDAALARLLTVLQSFPEEQLAAEARPGLTWYRTLTGVAEHNTYHAGQIALIRKILG